MKTIPISEARTHLPKLVDEVDRRFNRVLLTKSGHGKAVLMSSDEFDDWMETIEVLSNTKTIKALQVAQTDVVSGRTLTHQEVMQELKTV